MVLWAQLSFQVNLSIHAKPTAVSGHQSPWTSMGFSISSAFVDLLLFKYSAAPPLQLVWLTWSRDLQNESKVHCLWNQVLLSLKKPPTSKYVKESRWNKQRSLTLYSSPSLLMQFQLFLTPIIKPTPKFRFKNWQSATTNLAYLSS